MINRINSSNFKTSMGSIRKPTMKEETPPQKISSPGVPRDNFGFWHFTSEDLTPYGKVPVIISGKDGASTSELRQNIMKKFSMDQAYVKEDLELVGGFRVEVDPYNFKKLMKSLPQDASVVLDSKIKFPTPIELKPRSEGETLQENRPSLDIANSTLGINRLWEQGYTGKGIGICVIDSGIYPHKDFGDRIKGWVDMADGQMKPYDTYGHGTHVAGILAGDGAESAGKYRGVAPDADLVGIRISSVTDAIKGIQWAIENKEKYNIRVLNMSLGDFPLKSYKEDPWSQAAQKAWDAGIAVIVAAGNEGPNAGTISTPGINPNIITVGAFDDKNTPERSDDTLTKFSSRGPTFPDNIEKPDVVAPGVDLYGPLSPQSTLDTPDLPHIGDKYIAISGSSMATPLVSGLAALLIQANPDLTPQQLKEIIVSTADQYLPGATAGDQGKGVIDPLESLNVALARKQDSTNTIPFTMQELPMNIANTKGKNQMV